MSTGDGTIRGRALVPNPAASSPWAVRTPSAPRLWRVRCAARARQRDLERPVAAIRVGHGQRRPPGARVVEPGNLERGLRIVRAGLQRDDRVVINGMQRVRPAPRSLRPTAASSRWPEVEGRHGFLQAVHRPADSRRRDLGDDHAGRRRSPTRPSVSQYPESLLRASPSRRRIQARTPRPLPPPLPLRSSRRSTASSGCCISPRNRRPTAAPRLP